MTGAAIADRSESAASSRASQRGSGRIWVVSELYYPEETSTGYLLTRIAEGLVDVADVGVLCSQPTYSARGLRAWRTELRNGVRIERCSGTTLNKDRLAGRLLNLVTVSASIFLRALLRLRRGDAVLVVTNPPALPFLVLVACRIRGARCVLLVHDVYPEAVIAAGLLRRDSLVSRLLASAATRLYRAMDRIVVLGQDMRALVIAKLEGKDSVIDVIPNWADLDLIEPRARAENALLAELELENRFVVQYAGNMGRTHALEVIAAAARALVGDPDVTFLLIGSGAKRSWIEREVSSGRLPNVIPLGPRPREEQPVFLNACDVAIISFVRGMAGVSVPSRMYNVLAAGKPIIAVADSQSELARVVREERVGWVVAPDDHEGIARAVRDARQNPSRLEEMSRRARQAAVVRYSYEETIDRYRTAMRAVLEE